MIKNLTPNPFPSGKGNRIGGSNPFPSGKGDQNVAPTEPEKKVVDSEPPKIYIPACGVLCDVFWWARRDSPAEPPAAVSVKDETP